MTPGDKHSAYSGYKSFNTMKTIINQCTRNSVVPTEFGLQEQIGGIEE